jgi:hypothetical protein
MLIVEGVGGLSPAVFTETTPGPGTEGGGIANAIVGSLILTIIGIVIATPIGVLAGTYLAEYGKSSKLAMVIRFVNDILLAAPSILIGLFVYMLMVQPMGGYSGWAGGVALAIIAVPVIVRSTEDMLRLVPGSLREAGAALGAPMSTVHGDGRDPCDRTHCGRDRSASLHGAQQHLLVQPDPDGRRLEPARHDLPVCPGTLSELARARLGRRPHHHPVDPGAVDRGAPAPEDG